MNDDQRRITVSLTPDAEKALDQTVERRGLSKTDVVSRALVAYAYLDEQTAAGARVLVRQGNTTEGIRFL